MALSSIVATVKPGRYRDSNEIRRIYSNYRRANRVIAIVQLS